MLEVSKEIGLPIRKILDMLSWIKDAGSMENNELLINLGVSRNVLNQVKAKLSSFFEASSSATTLSGEGKLKVQEISQFLGVKEESLLNLDNQKIEQITKLLQKYQGQHPAPKRAYDQFIATSKTTAKRACLMDFFADIREKRILVLGDDDFTSLALASFTSAKLIQVVDIDERILQGVKNAAVEEGLAIEIAVYDACDKLPAIYKGKFDVVFCDPPYTADGIKLFLSRAIDALDAGNKSARIYLCFGNSDRAKERFLPIQEIITQSGLMIRWVFDKFNRYAGAESIGGSSTLFVCDITPKTRSLIKGSYDGEIYTNN